MDTSEIEEELTILQKKLQEGTITEAEESRFMLLYTKYAKIVEDEIKIGVLKNTLQK
jgi:hypothetical protein